MSTPPPGPTDEYPEGTIGPTDDGELVINVTSTGTGKVLLDFGINLSWVGMSPGQALELAKAIVEYAEVATIEATAAKTVSAKKN